MPFKAFVWMVCELYREDHPRRSFLTRLSYDSILDDNACDFLKEFF